MPEIRAVILGAIVLLIIYGIVSSKLKAPFDRWTLCDKAPRNAPCLQH